MDNLTLAACSYNTPEVTLTMLKSFFKYHDETTVLICENSTNNDTTEALKEAKVNYVLNKAGLHSPSVDILLQSCTTDYMLLVDTDIIFLQPHNNIFKQFIEMNLTLMGEICGDRGGKKLYNRVHPWHCFINVKNIKANNIKFYDDKRLSNQTNKKIYDVGASFFEDIKKQNLKIGNVKLQDKYYRHYEGMSWRTKKYGEKDGNIDIDSTATHNNVELYKYGLFVERMYQTEIDTYKNISIKAK
jgi:hypothetical protein